MKGIPKRPQTANRVPLHVQHAPLLLRHARLVKNSINFQAINVSAMRGILKRQEIAKNANFHA